MQIYRFDSQNLQFVGVEKQICKMIENIKNMSLCIYFDKKHISAQGLHKNESTHMKTYFFSYLLPCFNVYFAIFTPDSHRKATPKGTRPALQQYI